MMERQELAVLAKSLGRTVRDYVSAALIAISNRMDDFDARLKAIPAGPAGAKGEKGDAGQALIGPAGANGQDGSPGEKGLDGKDGRDGRDGKDGRDGERGRDALEIEILPAIDPAKSYVRGTYARDRGGLVRKGIEDWEVIVNGIADLSVIQSENLRSLDIDAIFTNGFTRIIHLSMPVLIYREIFKEGTAYTRGDVVTWAGSAWHCQSDTKSKPGDGSADWKLMVKRGQDGRAGSDGKDGERGPEGPMGPVGYR